MTIATLVPTIVGALGGVGGLVAFARARAQNTLDAASSRRVDAEAESIEVRTARGLIAEVRAEMDRRVSSLDQEIGRLRGSLEDVRTERDHLREVEATLRSENADLRARIERLEEQIADLTAELARAGRSAPGV
jgi:chromosome segregation ATPase